MRTIDKRLDRHVLEEIGVTTTLTESELEETVVSFEDDRDYRLIRAAKDDIVRKLRSDSTTRRAIVMTDEQACIVGVHVLQRDRLHVLAWFRSSDEREYRPEDRSFLYSFATDVRKELNDDPPIMMHIFTSSLHQEVYQ